MGTYDINIDNRLTNLENEMLIGESYDTGWVLQSATWAGAAFTATHNLNANLSDLVIKFFVSTDGTENNSFEPGLHGYFDDAANVRGGAAIYQVSLNEVEIQIGAQGLTYVTPTSIGLIDSENYYYRIVIYKPNALSWTRASLQSVGSYKYSTGWVLNSDWTFSELTITHNLNTPISDLIIKMFLSSDGTEANAIDLMPVGWNVGLTSGDYGTTIYAIDSNSFKVQVAAKGIPYIADSGYQTFVTDGTYYYKVVVYHPDVISVCTTPSTSSSGVYNYPPVFQIEDERANNIDGGTFTAGAWQTRDLNTIITNEIPGAGLNSNQFILPAGKYEVQASAPAFQVTRHETRIYNITDSITEISGLSAYCPAVSTSDSRSHLNGVFTITSTKTLEFQHFGGTTKTTNGLGLYSDGKDESIYAQVIIRQLEKF